MQWYLYILLWVGGAVQVVGALQPIIKLTSSDYNIHL